MKTLNKICIAFFFLFIAVFVVVNVYGIYLFDENDMNHIYFVEINRLEKQIAGQGLDSVDIESCVYVFHVEKLTESNEEKAFFVGDNNTYAIRNINNEYYRFDYHVNSFRQTRAVIVFFDIGMIIIGVCCLGILLYVRSKIIKPFHEIKDLPYELSKGNLSTSLKENRSRFFGKFIWGLDMLREALENHKQKELRLQKEKKTLVLAISHDIKTPLSAIKLYSQALSKNLYEGEEKKQEIVENINAKADEIEHFVDEIIKASSEEFLHIEVNNSEFYLNQLVEGFEAYYKERLELEKTDFTVEKYGNCIIKGDLDRAIEVIQNVMENAIKYGDGKYIKVSFEKDEDCILLSVANSGNTLSEDELPHIFDSFWRGSNAKDKKGNGLGLYICRQILLKMDGDIFGECRNGEMKVTVVLRMI